MPLFKVFICFWVPKPFPVSPSVSQYALLSDFVFSYYSIIINRQSSVPSLKFLVPLFKIIIEFEHYFIILKFNI